MQEILTFIVKKFGPNQYSKSKLTNAFSSLKSKFNLKSSDTIIPVDNKIFLQLQECDLKRLKTDALIGLIGMGADVKKLLHDDSFTLYCDFDSLDCVIHSIRDAAARSRFALYPCLVDLSGKYTGYQFQHILLSALSTVTRASDIFDITAALGLKPPGEATRENIQLKDQFTSYDSNRIHIVACYILDRLASLNNDDREYYAALCAESLLHYCDAIEFAHAFALVPILYNKIAQNIPFADPWPVGQTHCAPIYDDNEILPLESLSAIETIPLNWWKPHALEYLSVSVTQLHYYLRAELLTVFLFRVECETGADPFGGLAPPSFSTYTSPLYAIFDLISTIKDPYYRARALWRVW